MLNTVDGPTDAVEDYLCDPEEMPMGTRESRLPCPEDCVLSDWSPWTPCELVRTEFHVLPDLLKWTERVNLHHRQGTWFSTGTSSKRLQESLR